MDSQLIMSDDDIDIEEHDLLDNPLVRSMFPDLSIIKKEISDFDVAVPMNDITPKLLKSEDIKGHQSPAEVTVLKDFQSKDQNVKQYCNVIKFLKTDKLEMISKINNKSAQKPSSLIISKCQSHKILNTKMNDVNTKSTSVRFPKALNKTTVSKIKGRINNFDNSSCKNHDSNINSISSTTQNSCTEKISIKQSKKSEEQKSNNPRKQTLKGNKIVLGSRPKASNEAYNKTSILYNVKVTLQNVELFLNKSSRYCKLCMRLFASNKALTDHNNAIHLQTDRLVSVESHQSKNSSVFGKRYKFFTQKMNTRKKDKKLIHPSPDDIVNKEMKTFKCTHCNHYFASQQLLIDHMYNILQSKNQDVTDFADKVEDNGLKKRKLTSPQHYYRCTFCSYYFKTWSILLNHVRIKHKRTIKKKMEKIAFNPTCILCKKNYANVLSFNTHVWKFHQKATIAYKGKLKICKEKKRECKESISLNMDNLQVVSNNVDIKHHKKSKESLTVINDLQKCPKKKRFILKSALFKCVQCDVCFLSGSKAADHTKHMDELINWKCLKCLRIFKKEDEMLHTYQHLFSETFDVFEIRTTALLSLLYKCPNCITYFLENDLYSHYFCCETQPSQSTYCKICDILIDIKIQEIHDKHHNIIGKELTNIFVESDLIECNDESKTEMEEKEVEKKSTANNTLELKKDIEIEEKVDIDMHPKKHSVEQKKQILSFRYCNKCDSFISKMHNLYNHTKSPCSNLVNFVCKYCGLKISNKLINRHRKMHQRIPGLKLNQFKFYDLKGYKMERPPIPKYPNCHKCLKHFITKTAIISHKCNDMSYLTCPICDLKFSDLAFSLHKAFHHYSSKNDIPKDSNLALSNLLSKSDKNVDLNQTSLLKSSKTCDDYLLVYICKSCKIAVDTYDKVIEHCQDHIGNEPNERITKACDICNIIFDVECFDNHKMLHANNYNKRFTILNFDVFYSTSDINIWLDHLFGSLPKGVIDKILGKSIYNTERRIKLKIIQSGLIHLTFYKCAKCNTFMDSSLLYEHCHVNTFCQTSQIEICSSCGISLVSEEFRTKHEKIHDTENVTSKSYRIVLFNCEKDKNINYALSKTNHYILFECRNCSGIVDKRFYNSHKCNFSDLAKCFQCGLLLNSNDYMGHILKHKEFCSFIENNMKVILIGQPKDDFIPKGRIMSSFSGVKLDYLVYQCADCLVCLKEKKLSLIHKCHLSCSVRKCPDCELYFEVDQFVNHRILHECDVYFVRENITVIQFGSSYSKDSDEEIIVIEDEDYFRNKDKNIAIDCIDNPPETTEANEAVVNVNNLYQCPCGFHFLNQSSALSHYKTCSNNPRSVKQICSKCGLYFKPGVLFEHLLAHHGSKCNQKFNIIRICENMRLKRLNVKD